MFNLIVRRNTGQLPCVSPEGPRSPRLAALATKLAAHEPGAEDAFWHRLAAEGTPIVEDVHEPGHLLVTFVWHGALDTQRVQLSGLGRLERNESAPRPSLS